MDVDLRDVLGMEATKFCNYRALSSFSLQDLPLSEYCQCSPLIPLNITTMRSQAETSRMIMADSAPIANALDNSKTLWSDIMGRQP
jgi:hypothetical protein